MISFFTRRGSSDDFDGLLDDFRRHRRRHLRQNGRQHFGLRVRQARDSRHGRFRDARLRILVRRVDQVAQDLRGVRVDLRDHVVALLALACKSVTRKKKNLGPFL